MKGQLVLSLFQYFAYIQEVMTQQKPPLGARGRGARSNASGRFEAAKVEAFDDGWTDDDAALPAQILTTVTPLRSRTIISKNQSPDIGFERSINTYKGCSHGCSYCYARPSHAYWGLSPGLDFETRIFSKPDAAVLLERELSARKYVCKRIHVGGDTDPYQPDEKELRITRGVLEVVARFNHPISVITKSNLITRDLDILGPMGREKLASAFVSITTLDRSLARAMEPRASTPAKRLEAISRLAEAGVPVGVGFAPVIPGLNDHELESILEAAAKAGDLPRLAGKSGRACAAKRHSDGNDGSARYRQCAGIYEKPSPSGQPKRTHGTRRDEPASSCTLYRQTRRSACLCEQSAEPAISHRGGQHLGRFGAIYR